MPWGESAHIKLPNTLFGDGYFPTLNKGISELTDDGLALRPSEGFFAGGPFVLVGALADTRKVDGAFKPRYAAYAKPF